MPLRTYREQRRRTLVLWALSVAGALVGGLVAGALLTAPPSQPPPSLADVLERLRTTVDRINESLFLVVLEYSEGVEGELDAAFGHLERAEDLYASIRADLHLLDPAGTEEVDARFAELRAAVEARAPVAEVETAALAVDAALRAILAPYRPSASGQGNL